MWFIYGCCELVKKVKKYGEGITFAEIIEGSKDSTRGLATPGPKTRKFMQRIYSRYVCLPEICQRNAAVYETFLAANEKRRINDPIPQHLQSIQQPLTLKHKHNLMHRAPHTRLLDINRQIRLRRSLIRIINAREALNLAISGLGVDTALIGLLGVLEASSDMYEVEGAELLDQFASVRTCVFEGCDGGCDDGCAGTSEFGCDECDAADVAGAICAAEAELGRKFCADCLT
jgi:hypothetical protein